MNNCTIKKSAASILTGALFFLSFIISAQDSLYIKSDSASYDYPDTLAVKKQLLQKQIYSQLQDTIISEESITDKTEGIDSLTADKMARHSPHRATIMSAVLPGLGQAYNNRYWKIPVIYAVGGILYWQYDKQNIEFNKYWRLWNQETDENLKTQYYNRYSSARKKRDYAVIYMGILYIANIVDAMADAHFYSYDISDDLSMHVEPTVMPVNQFAINDFSYGFILSFSF
ncbi:MAG: hypothetical protein JW894_14720 [Bacteroidales bacterium]|nr:hypothetical protein [Bacteroidales bacterium]